LIGIGAITVPGIGPVLAAGPLGTALATTLVGAGIGAATGGIIGALVDAGVPEEEARLYQTGVERGGVLVTARVPAGQERAALDVLNANGARDVNNDASNFNNPDWKYGTNADKPHGTHGAGSEAAGGLAGAAAGAAIGTVVAGPLGTGIGAVIGGATGAGVAGASKGDDAGETTGSTGGAAAGAATGAAIGAIGGPVGMGAGAAIGAAVGGAAGKGTSDVAAEATDGDYVDVDGDADDVVVDDTNYNRDLNRNSDYNRS
jgi:hypothetical protein